MLRFLLLCDIWRWRLERWSRSDQETSNESTDASASFSSSLITGNFPSAASSDSLTLVSPVVILGGGDECLGTPLLSRATLRQRLRRFDSGLIEMGEAVADLFSSFSSATILWQYFLYRLGDPATEEFHPKLPPHAGNTSPLELLRPPRLKADPSLLEVAMLPRQLIKNAVALSSCPGSFSETSHSV